MAEVYTWSEASAYIRTGDGSALALFARDVNVTLNYGYHVYRVPHSNTYNYLLTGQEASMSIGQLYSQTNYMTMFEGTTAAHVHLKHLLSKPSQSAGIFLHSGRLPSVTLNGNDGQVFNFTVNGQFHLWSPYG